VRPARRAEAGPDDRDAGLLREAPHHGGLEGTWTAASKSTRACAWRANCCWTWPRWECPLVPSFWT
jgi:hypothetical protein